MRDEDSIRFTRTWQISLGFPGMQHEFKVTSAPKGHVILTTFVSGLEQEYTLTCREARTLADALNEIAESVLLEARTDPNSEPEQGKESTATPCDNPSLGVAGTALLRQIVNHGCGCLDESDKVNRCYFCYATELTNRTDEFIHKRDCPYRVSMLLLGRLDASA